MKITEYQKQALERSIGVMEQACEEAKRLLGESIVNDYSPLCAAEMILHTFAWAGANASTVISTAIASIAREIERLEYETQEPEGTKP